MMDQTLLLSHLSLCVPLEIDNLQRQGGATEWHIAEAQRRWKELGEPDKGGHESLLFRLPQTRAAIVTLTECLAVLAFVDGGVQFASMHFDACRQGFASNG